MHPFDKFFKDNKNAYNACGIPQGDCRIAGSYLCLQGSVVDHITRVSSVSEWTLASGGLTTERTWVPDNTGKLYFTGETLMEAFNHTVVADIGRRDLQSDSILSRGFAIDWEFVDRNTDDMTAEERQRQSWMLVDTKLMTFGRRFFETSRGFIGLGPPAACVNDQICVLVGGQVLYVLRTLENGHHEFVGECYVHGMMDGQICEDELFLVRDMVLE
jgi:hypothetical protein